MKLLADEKLPPRLVDDIADLFPDSSHVHAVGLSGTPDAILWEFAKSHGFTFVTKDKDFANLSMVLGAPPKVVLLQIGNCSTANLTGIVRRSAILLSELESDAKRSLLILR